MTNAIEPPPNPARVDKLLVIPRMSVPMMTPEEGGQR
jgi:hypothetical protein